MLSIIKISDKHILKGVGFCKRITAVVLKGIMAACGLRLVLKYRGQEEVEMFL